MIENISQLAPYLADEDKARELFERLRWPDGPVCPRCDHKDRIYKLQGKSTRPGLYKCGNCRQPFSVKVGSIFEGSHIPLKKWLYAIYLMCSSKKGVSAKQLERELDLTYKSAWFLCHRVRHAITQLPLVGKLGETYQDALKRWDRCPLRSREVLFLLRSPSLAALRFPTCRTSLTLVIWSSREMGISEVMSSSRSS